jgi:RNA-directed DNA polymerase
LEEQVKSWLKDGIVEELLNLRKENDILENMKGTPQGVIISPLLANIAIHGMEKIHRYIVIKTMSNNKFKFIINL